MKFLPTPLLSMISEWHIDKNLSVEDAFKLMVCSAMALAADSEDMSIEDLPFLSGNESENLAEAAFKEKFVELKKQKVIPLRKETVDLFAQVVHCISKLDVYNCKVWFLHFFYAYMDCLEQKISTMKSEHLNRGNYFALEESNSASNVAHPVRTSFISKIERDAYSYWIPRIYDEVFDARDAYETCIDELYDTEQFTMDTANKLLALPDQVEGANDDSRSFQFSQKLLAIRHPKTLSERFSNETFNLILDHFQ